MEKPPGVFARDFEWSLLDRFMGPYPGLHLSVMYGRRRQGKSFVLSHLSEAFQGLYHMALPDDDRLLALDRFKTTLGEWAGWPASRIESTVYRDWEPALEECLVELRTRALATGRPQLLVLDEYPFLLAGAPMLSGVIQKLYDRSAFREHQDETAPAVRLVLCGSTFSVMYDLLSGSRPLFGRSSYNIRMFPFDYRLTAKYWRVSDPEAALHLYAFIGGTPGYRRGVAGRQPLSSLADVERWVMDEVVTPDGTLYDEPSYVLREDPRMVDRSLYQTVLQHIAQGHTTPTKIGARMERPATALEHPLRVLLESRIIAKEEDVLYQRKISYHLSDPLLRFHHLVVQPRIHDAELGNAEAVWTAARDTVQSKILGPAFEEVCRRWTRVYGLERLGLDGGGEVGETTISCPECRKSHQIDVIMLGPGEQARSKSPAVSVLGEAKYTAEPRGSADLHRLDHLRAVLIAKRVPAEDAKLVIFARNGFTADLEAEARRRGDVVLVTLADLY
ncbi:AAA family ATPase [Planomonospora algeriensis]